MRLRALTLATVWSAVLAAVAWWAWHADLGTDAGAGSETGTLHAMLADPALLAGHVLRWSVVLLSAWLALATLMAAAAGLVGHAGVLRLALAMTPGVLRRIIRTAAASTMTAGIVAGPLITTASASVQTTVGGHNQVDAVAQLSSPDQGETLPVAVLRLAAPEQPGAAAAGMAVLGLARSFPEGVGEPSGHTATLRLAEVLSPRDEPGAATATLRLAGAVPMPGEPGATTATVRLHEVVPPPGEPGAATVTSGLEQAGSVASEQAASATRADGPRTWSVLPGESFWSIAADVMSAHLGRVASDAEIVGYWHGLIEVNAARLVVPGEPDLLFVGQQLTVPAPTTPR